MPERGQSRLVHPDRLLWVTEKALLNFHDLPSLRDLEALFVRTAKAIEENDERRPGGRERNRQLNAAARAAAQELRRHEQEQGCKLNPDDVAAEPPAAGRSAAPNQGAQERIRFVKWFGGRRFQTTRQAGVGRNDFTST
jgi:hypothetical protein